MISVQVATVVGFEIGEGDCEEEEDEAVDSDGHNQEDLAHRHAPFRHGTLSATHTTTLFNPSPLFLHLLLTSQSADFCKVHKSHTFFIIVHIKITINTKQHKDIAIVLRNWL